MEAVMILDILKHQRMNVKRKILGSLAKEILKNIRNPVLREKPSVRYITGKQTNWKIFYMSLPLSGCLKKSDFIPRTTIDPN